MRENLKSGSPSQLVQPLGEPRLRALTWSLLKWWVESGELTQASREA